MNPRLWLGVDEPTAILAEKTALRNLPARGFRAAAEFDGYALCEYLTRLLFCLAQRHRMIRAPFVQACCLSGQ
jgi:hypothetical protein